MEWTLENSKACVLLSSDGGQIYSFKLKGCGYEFMWQGDPKFWKGRNPTLFPQVGNTYTKTQILKGKECHMGNHGLARHATFKLSTRGEDFVELVFESDEKTLADYPYEFALYLRYTLKGSELKVSYRIENHDTDVMPFGFGLHPAFNCPIEQDESFDDYSLIFHSHEDPDSPEKALIKDHELKLDYSLFDKWPTIIMEHLNSAEISLRSSKHELVVTCANYPYVAFWTPKAPFICIEPWYSHGDFEPNDLKFEDRPGIIKLESGKSFYTEYAITLIK